MIDDNEDRDPRVAPPADGGRDIRPIVEAPRSGLPNWVWLVVMGLGGLLLFGVLNARRQSTLAPAVAIPAADHATSAAPPPLYVPPPELTQNGYPSPQPDTPAFEAMVIQPQQTQPQPADPHYQDPVPAQDPYYGAAVRRVAPLPANIPSQPELTSAGSETSEPGSVPPGNSAAQVRAGRVSNHATTVLQGTLVPAVLETGFDSSRPGYARALVQRDIRGFDGSRVLIPRGSRLIGEYSSEAGLSQKRAMIAWTRLIRPDGVTIAIASPVSDPVGRGGVRASVNNHFFERFSGAILQSTLDIGVNLASRSAGSPVVIALPGGLQRATSSVTPSREIAPTLSVRPGTSVSVFVARDLDFTDVETRP